MSAMAKYIPHPPSTTGTTFFHSGHKGALHHPTDDFSRITLIETRTVDSHSETQGTQVFGSDSRHGVLHCFLFRRMLLVDSPAPVVPPPAGCAAFPARPRQSSPLCQPPAQQLQNLQGLSRGLLPHLPLYFLFAKPHKFQRFSVCSCTTGPSIKRSVLAASSAASTCAGFASIGPATTPGFHAIDPAKTACTA